MAVNIIQLGDGKFVINHGYLGEEAALFIEPAPKRGKVGASAAKSGISKTECVDGGTVIVLGNLASAAVLAQELDKAARRIGTRRGMGPLTAAAGK